MGFRQADASGKGGYARLWSVENKGKYSIAKISTSRKVKDSDIYETDFQDGYVRLIGDAHKAASELAVPEKGIGIQILSCDTTKIYNKEAQQSYINFIVYNFKLLDGKKPATKSQSAQKPARRPSEPIVDEDDEDLPF